MKQIKLTKNQYTLVDDEDFEFVSKRKWHVSTSGYAIRKTKFGIFQLHRVLMNVPNHLFIDHINHNKLDNQKNNLRLCTKTQNQGNLKKRSHNTSGYKGVYFDKVRNLYVAEIHQNYKKYFLGRYEDIKDAARAYNKKAIELFGEFALLNKI